MHFVGWALLKRRGRQEIVGVAVSEKDLRPGEGIIGFNGYTTTPPTEEEAGPGTYGQDKEDS